MHEPHDVGADGDGDDDRHNPDKRVDLICQTVHYHQHCDPNIFNRIAYFEPSVP